MSSEVSVNGPALKSGKELLENWHECTLKDAGFPEKKVFQG